MLENNSALFPSRSVDYDIRLIHRSTVLKDSSSEDQNNGTATNSEDLSSSAFSCKSPPDPTCDTAEERAAKIEDLLHFVSEISNLDSSSSNGGPAAAGKRERKKSLAAAANSSSKNNNKSNGGSKTTTTTATLETAKGQR